MGAAINSKMLSLNIHDNDTAFINVDFLGYPDFVDNPSELDIGQMYKDKSRLKDALCKFAMRNHCQYKVLTSNK